MTKLLTKDSEELEKELEENKRDSYYDKLIDFVTDRFIADGINVHASGSWKYIAVVIILIGIFYIGLDPNPEYLETNVVLGLFLTMFVSEAFSSIFTPGKIIGLSYSFLSTCVLVYAIYTDFESYSLILITLIVYFSLFLLNKFCKRFFLRLIR